MAAMSPEQKLLDHWMGALSLAALLKFSAFALPEHEQERLARLTEEAEEASRALEDAERRAVLRHAILREEGLA